MSLNLESLSGTGYGQQSSCSPYTADMSSASVSSRYPSTEVQTNDSLLAITCSSIANSTLSRAKDHTALSTFREIDPLYRTNTANEMFSQ